MNKIPTLYSDYRECILDLEIYGKIVSTPQQSIQELTDTLFEEFKRRKPLPTLEYKRYKLSRLVNPDFRIAYNRELELQENESLVDLDNVISNIEPIDFEDLTPLVTEVQELFSYENNVTDSVRDEIISKYDLNTGERFKPGIAETENIVGSVQEDESLILSDEEIENIGVSESENSTEEFDSESTDGDDSYDSYFDCAEDNSSESEDTSDSPDGYSEEDDSDDLDDYSDYDNYETTGEDDSDSSDDYSDEGDYSEEGYSDEDDYSGDGYSDEDDSDSLDDYSDDYSDEDDYSEDDYSDEDDYSEDDYSDEDDYSEDGYSDEDGSGSSDDYSDYDSYETTDESDSDSLNDEDKHEFIDSVLDEPTFEEPEEFIKPVEVAIPVTPAQIHNDIAEPEIIDRSTEPTDIRAFLRKHPRCEMSFALKYFTKKQISDAIKIGKVIKKGNILKI